MKPFEIGDVVRYIGKGYGCGAVGKKGTVIFLTEYPLGWSVGVRWEFGNNTTYLHTDLKKVDEKMVTDWVIDSIMRYEHKKQQRVK